MGESMRRGAGLRTVLGAGVCVAALSLTGCQTDGLGFNSGLRQTISFDVATAIPDSAADTVARRAVRDGMMALRAGKYDEASRHFNLALKLEITRSELQFLNGFAYHMMAVQGDESKFPLAEEGYKLALKFDSTNWTAEYFLGLAYLDQRKFTLAEDALLRAATVRPDDPDVLYDLARAAYYAGDPRTADAALNGFRKLAPERATKPSVLKALSVTKAALDQRSDARAYFAAYETSETSASQVRALSRRLDGWAVAYDEALQGGGGTGVRQKEVELAQFPPSFSTPPTPSFSTPPTPGFAQPPTPSFPGQTGFGVPQAAPIQPVFPAPLGGYPGQSGFGTPGGQFGGQGFFNADMVVVDVVLIGIEEDRRESRGINLLSGLQLQFGDPLRPLPAYSIGRNSLKNLNDSTLSENTRTITSLISIPSVTYSLNIANSLSGQSHILARPSLVALSGQASEFFSGVDIAAAAVSGGQGDSVSIQKEVGVKLRVVPEFLPDNMIRLHVIAERTFLTDPSQSVLFQFRLDTTKTIVNSTVAMKFGETLILGGLSERENSGLSDGVPGLKEIPLVNLLFNRQVKREFERSILILLTPRRPQYGARSPEDTRADAERLSEFERSLEKFERRQQQWFIPRKTFNEVMDRLEGGDFSNEFRTGDIEGESWHRRGDVQEKMGEILDRVFQG